VMVTRVALCVVWVVWRSRDGLRPVGSACRGGMREGSW
jgi:hypothetical protein